MPPLGLTELGICLLPVAIVLVILGIVVIVIFAARRKPAAPPDAGAPGIAQEDPGAGAGVDDAGGIEPPIESPVRPRNGLATASLVLGITVVPAHILLGLNWSSLLGISAVITGVIALLQISRRGGRGKGAAIAGTALGALPFILTVGATLLLGFTTH
jgi:hypothetical protein